MASGTDSIRLVHGSCTDASRLCPDLIGRVTLAVTSPPYHNAISYESHATSAETNYRPRQGIDYANVYLPLMDDAWRAMHTLLRPGGYLAVNVGTVLENGYHHPLPMDIVSQLTATEGEWEFIRNIMWHKVTAGVKRAGSVIQHKLPGYWYPNIMTEHIIVVRKPGPALPVNTDVPDEWWEEVWDLAPVPPRSVDHPAPFPEDLPHRLIRMLSMPADIIADPFNGSGSTTKAASDLDRIGVGFDIEQKYLELAYERRSAPTAVRKVQLRVIPQLSKNFIPRVMRGKTRHGSGLNSRGRQ